MTIEWPHVPRHRAEPACDRCGKPGHDPLCPTCQDDTYWADKIKAEEKEA